jgi:hypothetical protein
VIIHPAKIWNSARSPSAERRNELTAVRTCIPAVWRARRRGSTAADGKAVGLGQLRRRRSEWASSLCPLKSGQRVHGSVVGTDEQRRPSEVGAVGWTPLVSRFKTGAANETASLLAEMISGRAAPLVIYKSSIRRSSCQMTVLIRAAEARARGVSRSVCNPLLFLRERTQSKPLVHAARQRPVAEKQLVPQPHPIRNSSTPMEWSSRNRRQ